MSCKKPPSPITKESGTLGTDGRTTFTNTYETTIPNAGPEFRVLEVRVPLLKGSPVEISSNILRPHSNAPIFRIHNIKTKTLAITKTEIVTQIVFNARQIDTSLVRSEECYCLEFTIIGEVA